MTGNEDVLEDVQLRDEVVALEYEAQARASQLRELVVAEAGDASTSDAIPLPWAVDAPEDVEQGALPEPELPMID